MHVQSLSDARGANRPRFLSEADCRDIEQRLARYAHGGGYTVVSILSTWTGAVRWARNQISTEGEVQTNRIAVRRMLRSGASGTVTLNDTTDAALVAALRRAERLASISRPLEGTKDDNEDLITRLPLEPTSTPSLFSDATYQLDAIQRAATALALTKQAAAAGMLSAGTIQVAAVGMGLLDTLGRVRYFPYTQASYSVTVRDPDGTGSGWAGVDWYDWQKIDAQTLTRRALDKCLTSRNPVAVEPGRYTTILEPQAVCDFVGPLIYGHVFDRSAMKRGYNEGLANPAGPFFKSAPPQGTDLPAYSKLGENVVDARLTISADPMDPDAGFPPFDLQASGYQPDPFVDAVYHPVTWIEHGRLMNLSMGRIFGRMRGPGRRMNWGLPNSGAFRMSGGETSVADMIATTKRGLLVTRFDAVEMLDMTSQLYRGLTRDGLWLIENGKISKAVKNLVFTESILFALNNIDQLGPPQRVFHPDVALHWVDIIPQPVVVPPLKIRDFSFTALFDAV